MSADFIDTLPTGEDSPWWLSTNCDVVHRKSCRHARHPWMLAVYWAEPQMRSEALRLRLRLCRVCLPERSEG